MIDPEFLYAVAQVGATYAGFSTLVAVVAYRRNTGAAPSRIYFMLLLSVVVVAFSFVPSVIRNYGASQAVAWRMACGLYGLVWGAYWINALITLKSRFRIPDELMSFLNKLHTFVIHPGAILVLLLGAAGLWGDSTGAAYVTALFVMLYMSAYLFLQIVTGLLEHEESS